MCMLTTVPDSAQAREERVPVVVGVVHRGQPEEGRDLAEADRSHAPVGVAPHLGGGQPGVPQRDDGEGDQAALRLRAAPLLDHPVVVGLHAEQGELFVLGLGEGLAAEPGEGGEADRGLEVVDVHVLEPRRHLVGAGAHVLVGDAPHGDLVTGDPDGRVDPQEGALEVLVVPPVGREPLGPGIDGQLAADEGDLAHRGPHHPRTDLLVLVGEPVRPDPGRLHHVVVDGDDLRHVGHDRSVTPDLTVHQVAGRACDEGVRRRAPRIERSDHGHPAVGAEHLAGHEPGGVRGEVEEGRRRCPRAPRSSAAG